MKQIIIKATCMNVEKRENGRQIAHLEPIAQEGVEFKGGLAIQTDPDEPEDDETVFEKGAVYVLTFEKEGDEPKEKKGAANKKNVKVPVGKAEDNALETQIAAAEALEQEASQAVDAWDQKGIDIDALKELANEAAEALEAAKEGKDDKLIGAAQELADKTLQEAEAAINERQALVDKANELFDTAEALRQKRQPAK